MLNTMIDILLYSKNKVKYIPYMNTTTHGCDHEGSCKISTVLLLKSCY